jgi:N-acetylmuramoyl-L-alanine amidase
MKINKHYSLNFNKKKRSKNSIKLIVIHYTGMQSERESLNKLCNPKSEVSSHYFINRTGKIYRLVEDRYVAWHAGKSFWGRFKNLNKNSIGIELVNKGHEFGYNNFKKKQITCLIKICKILIKKYKIKDKNIVGHSDIAPLRKIDPGERFPWKQLAKKNIGIWHNYKSNSLKDFRKKKLLKKKDEKKFIKNLNNIGYCFTGKNKLSLNRIFKAFQRRFRQELINGILDQECLIISENLSKISKKP